ncbi:tyrosine-type recombinase/integrase [Pseudomonadota bacterium]
MREKLTWDFCTQVDKPGYYADGGGLYLNVKAGGRKYWCFRWRDRHQRYPSGKSAGMGKLREKGLGRAGRHDVTLEEARRLAGECRKLVQTGQDPISQPQAATLTAPQPATLTFADCITACIEMRKPTWQNQKSAWQWNNSLHRYAAALLPLPVTAIDANLVMTCIEPIWEEKTETAMRVRQRIESVLDWATEHGHRAGENPARWRGNLDGALPKPARLKATSKPEPLAYKQVASFMNRLRAIDSLAARALELQILTAARPGDVVGAKWDEFRLKGAVWTLPAERAANHREQTIPLSLPALSLLKALPQTSVFVFPGRTTGTSMTTAAGMKLLKSLQPGLTQQGFRTTFRQWAASESGFPAEVIELALNNQPAGMAEAASLRSDLIAQGARLMRDWAAFCESDTELELVPGSGRN